MNTEDKLQYEILCLKGNIDALQTELSLHQHMLEILGEKIVSLEKNQYGFYEEESVVNNTTL